MRIKKNISVLAVLFILIAMMTPMLVQASPPDVWVNNAIPPAYLPLKTTGAKFWVDFMINADDLEFNGDGGMIWWKLIIDVDRSVLKPFMVKTATLGYFLYDFTQWAVDNWLEGYSYPQTSSAIDDVEGSVEVTEMYFAPLPPGGAATDDFELPAPRKLVSIAYEVVDDGTHSSPIDFVDGAYSVLSDPETQISLTMVSSSYGPPDVPEFPLGSIAPIALIAAIAYIWWVTKRKTREAM